MRTLGIDLAAQPENTAACVIEWLDGAATVELVKAGMTDADMLAMAKVCDGIGIDSPFGWPLPLIAFLNATHPARMPPADLGRFADDRQLRYRRTDIAVKALVGKYPLAVGMTFLAAVAVRCLRLQSQLGVVDRGGDGRVYEVYPRASRIVWMNMNLPALDGPPMAGALADLLGKCPWLQVKNAGDFGLLAANAHAYDALIAAFTARAAKKCLAHPIPPADRTAARSEGWIAVPIAGALAKLPN